MGTKVDIEHVAQTLLDEHHGNYRTAFYDLCGRFVAVAHGVSSGYMRWNPEVPSPARIDDVANPICDTWIATGREGVKAE